VEEEDVRGLATARLQVMKTPTQTQETPYPADLCSLARTPWSCGCLWCAGR